MKNFVLIIFHQILKRLVEMLELLILTIIK